MKIRITKVYKDVELNRLTVLNEVLDVSDNRGKHLVENKGFAEYISKPKKRKTKK